MPQISIITTTYKHAKFIAETIESVLNQTFTDRELLIGDDSPDNETRNIIQTYTKKYSNKIKTRHHKPNKWIVENMNFLLSQTNPSTKYVAFLEGDDLRYPDYLTEKMKIFQKYPNVWLVYNELSLIDAEGNFLEKRRLAPRTKKWYKNETITIGNFFSSDMICYGYSTLMSRKYNICIHNYDKSDLMGTEVDYLLQIAENHAMYGIQKPLSSYRKHTNNTSKNLTTSISHFEFLVEKYIAMGKVDKPSITKVKILIAMMKSVANIANKKRKNAIKNIIYCCQLSIPQTCIMGFRSLRYRMLKPTFYLLKQKLWTKSTS